MFLGTLVLLNFALKTNITIMAGKRNKVNFFFFRSSDSDAKFVRSESEIVLRTLMYLDIYFP